MTVERVDIRALNTLYFENILGMNPDEQAQMFEGSDLLLDKKSGALKRLVTGQADPLGADDSVTLEQEVEYVRLLRSADADTNGSLVVKEIRLMLQSALSAEHAAQVDPQAFLDAVAVLMEKRYRPISQNVKQFRGALAFRPTLDALEIYNHGLYLDDMLHADAVFSPSRIGKTLTNAALFVPKLGIKIFDHDTSVLQGDQWAADRAKSDYGARQKSLENLKKAINEGVEKEEPWALEGDLKGALAKLSSGDRENLGDRMMASEIHRILGLTDPKERYVQLREFAVRERPGFLGFGGGNAEGWNFWNISGKHNNLYFAKSALAFLLSKATTGDQAFDTTMRLDSRNIRKEMLGGENAGFNNILSVGLTGVGCGVAWLMPWTDTNMDTCVTDYQPWGDEDKITGFGRSLEIGLLTFSGNRFITRAGQFNRLRQLEGWRSAGRAWWDGLKATRWTRSVPVLGWNLYGGKPLAKAAEEAQELAKSLGTTAPATRLGRAVHVLTSPIRWTWQGVTWPFRKLWKTVDAQLPPLSPEAKAVLTKAGNAGKKLPGWVRGTLVLSAAVSIDARTQPYYNPYELDQEANFDRYPDPAKPPVLKK
ncbi:MAG TPA: hypothetical protein VJR29_01390 [bacterium]|nr:hypothetical protein [bacterium]